MLAEFPRFPLLCEGSASVPAERGRRDRIEILDCELGKRWGNSRTPRECVVVKDDEGEVLSAVRACLA